MDEIGDIAGPVVAKRKGGRPKGTPDSKAARQARIDRKVLELRAKNVPIPAIAAAVNLSPRTISLRISQLRNVLNTMDKLEDWEAQKGNLLSAAQHEILRSMMQESKLEKASVNNLAYALTQVHQATRLERGQATQQIASHVRFSKIVPDSAPSAHTDAPLPDLIPTKPIP